MSYLLELQSKLKLLKSRIRFEVKGDKFRIRVLYSNSLPLIYRTDRHIEIKKDDFNNNYVVELLIKGSPFRGCARVVNNNELSKLLYEWLDKRSSFEILKNQFADFEYLKPFPNQNLSREKEAIWIRIKSQLFFYYIVCWNKKESFLNYERLMTAIRGRKEFHNLYPTISHHWLRFTINNDYSSPQYLKGYFMASNTSYRKMSNYYVSVHSQTIEDELYSDEIEDVIAFFISKNSL